MGWIRSLGRDVCGVALYFPLYCFRIGVIGFEGERLLQILQSSGVILVVKVGVGEHHVGFGAGTQTVCRRCFVASWWKLVFEEQGVRQSGVGTWVGDVLGEGFPELFFGFSNGATGKKFAGSLDVDFGTIRGLGLAYGHLDGFLQLDGKLAI